MTFINPAKLLLISSAAEVLLADTTINSTDKYAYSANAGWINFEADVTNGIVFTESFLSGFAYSANFGWIHFGDGIPTDGISYDNSSGSDFGVNHDGIGNLTGFAYAANIGWVNFEQTQGKPRVDLETGKFSGHVYSSNVGWIDLATNLTTDTMACPDLDNDGIADFYEFTYFGNLISASVITDSDHDSHSDLQEYFANTNPVDPSSFLRLCLTSLDTPASQANIEVSAGPGRILVLRYGDDLPTLANHRTYSPLTAEGTFSDFINYSSIPIAQQFFRIEAQKPLQP